MKKIITIFFAALSLYSGNSFAQHFAATVVASSVDTLTFSVKPDATFTTGLSSVEFFLIYPTTDPGLTFGTPISNTTNFPGMGTWTVLVDNPADLEPNYHVIHFEYVVPQPTTTDASYTSGTSYDIMKVPVTSGLISATSLKLVDEEPSETPWYLAIAGDIGNDLRPVSPSNYFYPSTSTMPDEVLTTETDYYIAVANAPLPVTFISFSATLQNDNGDLTWNVANESSVTKYYVVQKSIDNGISYSSIDTVLITKPNANNNTYSYTDANLSLIKAASNTIYYRIKQVDDNGVSTYSTTDIIKLPSKADPTVTVYPNPVQDFAKIKFYLDEDALVTMNLADINGRVLQSQQIQGTIGENTPAINMSSLVNGNYILTLHIGSVVHTFPLIKAN